MVLFLFNTVIYVFLLLGLCILIVQLPWLRFFRAYSTVVRQIPRRGTARTLPKRLCCSMYCLFLSFCVLFVCKCVLYYCHRVSTQLQLNISYHIQTSVSFHSPFTSLHLPTITFITTVKINRLLREKNKFSHLLATKSTIRTTNIYTHPHLPFNTNRLIVTWDLTYIQTAQPSSSSY
jgi:hypothetical protein